jgi:hypothetical protein
MTNMLRMVFEHPQAKTVFGEREAATARTVHAVRLNAGCFSDEPEVKALVSDLLEESAESRALWQQQTARGPSRTYKIVHGLIFAEQTPSSSTRR